MIADMEIAGSLRLLLSDEELRRRRDAAAVAFLRRTGNDDLIPMLGLGVVGNAPGTCGYCGEALTLSTVTKPKGGGWHRGFCSKRCHAAARNAT